MTYLGEMDKMVLVELLHDIMHNHQPCYRHMVKDNGECAFFQNALYHANKGYLVIIQNLFDAKVGVAIEAACTCETRPHLSHCVSQRIIEALGRERNEDEYGDA